MIKIRADHKNKKVFVTINQGHAMHKRGIRWGLFAIGRENVKHTRRLILDKNKNGRLYFIRGKIHQASAPGEAPANLSGKLQKSVNYKVRGSSQMEFGDEVYYGKFLESPGTKRILPRPHLETTVKDREKDNINILQRHLDKDRRFREAR
jgi:hypothetical protein